MSSIFSSGNDYTYVSGVNDSCIAFSMSAECSTANAGAGIKSFAGLIAQSVQCSCARQPTIVYELGTKNYYAVDAKPQGQGRLQNILGPTAESVQSLKTLGNICNPTTITIDIKPCSCFCHPDRKSQNGKDTIPTKLTKQTGLTFTGGFLSNVTLSATAKDLVVQGTWDFIFQDLQLHEGQGGNI